MEDMIDGTVSSEDLMVRIAEGDDSAFEILVHRHHTSVLNLIYRFIGDRTQAKVPGSRSIHKGLAGGQKL